MWIEKQITIINKLGLHARASAKFVQTASQFECELLVYKDKKMANGKNMLDLMMLAAGLGSIITLKASGKDATLALETLSQLIDNRFGEIE